MFEKVKYYYDNGLWNIQRIYNVVGKAINETEYMQITGFIYPAIE
ncbi:MAG: XkdX family protein [Sedimentibacter sp.]